MGVVYKARDSRLDRTVALKFLAKHLLDDPEAKERFLREAKAAAGLDHPNVCTVHEIGEADGKTFLSMAFIEGQSLEARIEQGLLQIAEALDIGRQIAVGLEAAHEKGIIHRDIKPANILIDPKGRAVIMDFGLARLAERSRLTKPETTLGTVAYMSPEQLQGEGTDHRSDIWSLGVVLYEMVTGLRPFKGEYDQALGYEIVNQQPEPLTGVRAGVPMELEFLTAKCLEKDADKRYGSAAELAVDLSSAADRLKSGQTRSIKVSRVAHDAIQPMPAPEPERRPWLPAALAVVMSLAFLAVAVVHFSEAPPEAPLRRFAITPPVAIGTSDGNDITVAISPNGKHIVFVEDGPQGKLWVQDLDQRNARVLDGTEGAHSPFWSPGSDFIGFAVASAVKKVPLQGGRASDICGLPNSHFHGPSWSPDGEVITFGSGTPHSLYEVPARGGTPRELIAPDEIDPASGEAVGAVYWSHFLPPEAGARVVLLAFQSQTTRTMAVQDLASGRREYLGRGMFPFYSRSGHLVYQPANLTNDLWGLPFSLETLQATGEAFPLAQNSRHASIAADQTMVYLDGSEGSQAQLVWVGRDGAKRGEIAGARGALRYPALSPDERRMAYSTVGGGAEDLWVYDIARGSKTRLNTQVRTINGRPVWSPTGEQVAYRASLGGNLDILVRRSDGSGPEEVLAGTPFGEAVPDWSRDGNYILYQVRNPATLDWDLWYLERSEGGAWEARPYLEIPEGQTEPKLSPDGRYVAYVSNESGRQEVYVQPFPDGGRRVTVSSIGGTRIRWSRDGTELFYVEGSLESGTLVAVPVTTGESF